MKIFSEVAVKLENAGTDFIVICTNTMHKIELQISACVSIPIIHIVECTANKIKEKLAGEDEDILLINNIIYDKLCLETQVLNQKYNF